MWSECFVFAAATAVICLHSPPSPPSGGQLLFSHPCLPLHPSLRPELWGSYSLMVIKWELGWGSELCGAFQRQKYSVEYSELFKRTRENTHINFNIGGFIPTDSQLVSLRRGEEVRLFTLERIPLCLWSKHTVRDRLCPFSPHLSFNKLDAVYHAVCGVWL